HDPWNPEAIGLWCDAVDVREEGDYVLVGEVLPCLLSTALLDITQDRSRARRYQVVLDRPCEQAPGHLEVLVDAAWSQQRDTRALRGLFQGIAWRYPRKLLGHVRGKAGDLKPELTDVRLGDLGYRPVPE